MVTLELLGEFLIIHCSLNAITYLLASSITFCKYLTSGSYRQIITADWMVCSWIGVYSKDADYLLLLWTFLVVKDQFGSVVGIGSISPCSNRCSCWLQHNSLPFFFLFLEKLIALDVDRWFRVLMRPLRPITQLDVTHTQKWSPGDFFWWIKLLSRGSISLVIWQFHLDHLLITLVSLRFNKSIPKLVVIKIIACSWKI